MNIARQKTKSRLWLEEKLDSSHLKEFRNARIAIHAFSSIILILAFLSFMQLSPYSENYYFYQNIIFAMVFFGLFLRVFSLSSKILLPKIIIGIRKLF